MTILYLIRHSVKYEKKNYESYNAHDDHFIKDEKSILSVEGEKRAEKLCKKHTFDKVEKIYASSMVRSIQTAKYLSTRLNLPINIDERLNERRVGVYNEKEYPNWYQLQYQDKFFKTKDGECQEDVCKRMNEAIEDILNQNKNKEIAVFSHGYAITFAILKWCELVNVDQNRKLTFKFKNKIFYDKVINAPEVFKLVFDEKNKLKSIKVIEYKDIPYHHSGV